MTIEVQNDRQLTGRGIEEPAASVIIPTRNRRQDLAVTLERALQQTVPLEVLVMDDASTDGTPELVRRDFPHVSLFEGDAMRGPAYRRNLGAAHASTPYLVTLDDDCQLSDPDTVRHTLELFTASPRIGAVTIPFVNVLSDEQVRCAAPSGDDVYLTSRFYGGMIIIRTDVYLAAGGYPEHFFMHVEEADLAARMLAAGYIVRLGDAPPIHHHKPPERDASTVRRLGPRNQVLYAWHNTPMPYMPVQLVGSTLKGLTYALRRGHLLRAATAYLRGYAALLRHRRHRNPLPRHAYRLLHRLKQTDAVRLADAENALASIPLLTPNASEPAASGPGTDARRKSRKPTAASLFTC